MNPSGGDDFYKPSGGSATAEPPATPQPGAAAPPAKPPTNGAHAWTASEYIHHSRGASWYLGLFGVTIVLAAAIYFFTKEIFATAVIVVLGAIVGVYSRQSPKQMSYELSSSGLRVGEKMYAYGLFKSFSLVKDGTLNSLQLTPLKKLMPPISAYYDAGDEEKITDIIGQHLPFEDAKPDRIGDLSRRLKL